MNSSLPLVATSQRIPGRKPPLHWMDLTPAQRVQAVTDLGMPAFRARQISTHWFNRLEADPTQWSDLPAQLRPQLADQFLPRLLTPVQQLTADAGTTVKTAWRLFDGSIIESVLMRYPTRTTVCISSEAGCGMNCPFCATGQGGLQRNLSTGEIVGQVVEAARQLAGGQVPYPQSAGVLVNAAMGEWHADTALGSEADRDEDLEVEGRPGRPQRAGTPATDDRPGGHLTNVVFMGMGEPMANYVALIRAIRQLVTPQPDGLGLSARGVTVSTVGMVPRMRALADEHLPVTLAVSLHAPDDELRDELVPLNRHFNVDAVLDAAWDYAQATRRRVSIEYALIRDVNDQPWRADLLAKRLRERGDWGWVHVNLIPLNPTPGSRWTAATPAAQQAFVTHLERHHVPVTVRDTRGREIDGACGQLAATVNARG